LKNKYLNVGVDIDGVLSNFTGAARSLCKSLFNGKPSDDLVQTGWGFDSIGITKEEENLMWRVIDAIPNWWLTHEPMPCADMLPYLCEKARVVFITNRKDGTGQQIADQSSQWITDNFGIKNPNVIISDNKGPVASGLNLDYYIDDRPKNVEEVGFYIKKTAILDATYNQDFKWDWRVNSFNDFAYEVMGLPKPSSVINTDADRFDKLMRGGNWSR
jgi:5'(3')-deoxyribonucleotidase